MRTFATILALALALVASPALAGGLDFNVTADNAQAGFEGIITSPAAPVLGVVNGDDRFDLPCPAVLNRVVGAVTGSVTFGYQLGTGIIDLLFALPAAMGGVPSVSPDPVIDLFGSEASNPGIGPRANQA
jgi:hypothetical protein